MKKHQLVVNKEIDDLRNKIETLESHIRNRRLQEKERQREDFYQNYPFSK